MNKSKLPTHCPSCQKTLQVTHLYCETCNIKIEGLFVLPAILSLTPEEQLLMLEYVKSNGSPKRLSNVINLSYPAIRSRLDKLIEKLQEI
ncbi:MAG: DUF2089 family protein [Salinivirgaceae bacterium]|nr:DUF2089 family protein [Salinivirgaceae bacterium]